MKVVNSVSEYSYDDTGTGSAELMSPGRANRVEIPLSRGKIVTHRRYDEII
jgi:hypothetical protein